MSVDVVEWIADLLKTLQPDQEDQPESKEEPIVEEECLTSVTIRQSMASRVSESSVASSNMAKEEERRVQFAVTKQIR